MGVSQHILPTPGVTELGTHLSQKDVEATLMRILAAGFLKENLYSVL